MPSRSATRFWPRTAAFVAPAADDGASGFGCRCGSHGGTDDVTSTRLGHGFTLGSSWQFLMGYRFGILDLTAP